MKKLFCILLASLFILTSAAVIPVFADEATGQTTPPDCNVLFFHQLYQ